MADARIEVEIGQFRFSGEGEQQWLAQQMDKLLKSAETLTKLAPPGAPPPPDAGDAGASGDSDQKPSSTDPGTLPKFLRGVTVKNQTDKFLATAEWLRQKGKTGLTTKDVSGAIRKAQHNRLTNASQCLNSNVSAGRAEKDGSAFYVTDEGRKHLGLRS